MKNILNILIIFMLVLLFFNLFWWNNSTPKTWLDISFAPNNYTVPASVKIKVSNYTDQKINLNACTNLEIRKNWEKMSFDENFCKNYENFEVDKKTVWEISFQDQYEKFKETWKYSLEVNLSDGKKFTSDMTIGNKWTISKLFTYAIYAPIYNLFIWLISIFQGSFGWAIISVTIIIRLALIWPQHRTMLSQKKLQALQPKIKKIQDENKWNQQVIWIKIMELYKKEKVNPFGSCGFLFIQIPILLVLYNVILSIKDHSNTYYLYWALNQFDISSINFNFFDLNLLQNWWTQWLILAIAVWLIQFIQIKLSLPKIEKPKKEWIVLEKKSGKEGYNQMMPDPEIMNKFMLYVLPVMIWFTTYAFFAGLGVYWWISTLFMLFQQLIVNKILNKSS